MTHKLYGIYAVGDAAGAEPIRVDHVLGGRLSSDAQGRPTWVDLQFEVAGKVHPVTLQLDFLNALFLLSVVKSMQLDSGQPFPDDPRA